MEHLIITGPQASGKTERLKQQTDKYLTSEILYLNRIHVKLEAVRNIKLVVFSGVGLDEENVETLKALVSEVKYEHLRFIVVTNTSIDALKDCRRFTILHTSR